MRNQVLQRMDDFGAAASLRVLVERLPGNVSIVVKRGVGDFLPLAASAAKVAGIYMNKTHLHLLLDPSDAKALSTATGCRIVKINGTTGYVRVSAAEAEEQSDAVLPYVEAAMRRSAGRSSAAVAEGPSLMTDQDASVTADETIGDNFSAHFALPCVVLRINRLWYPGMPNDELYDATRGWWRMGARRDQVGYAVAVAQGVVRAVYSVDEWLARRYEDDGVTPRDTIRWGFVGQEDEEHEHLVGLDVRHLFPRGAQNPVTYFNLDQAEPALTSVWTSTAAPVERLSQLHRIVARLHDNPVLVLSLHSKELFHSNLLGWLAEKHPAAAAEALRPWLMADRTRVESRVRREKNHLDLIIELPGFAPLVIENKVFSLPDEAQLLGYVEKNIPAAGVVGGTCVLLSLMDPGWPDRTFEGWTWAPWTEVVARVAARPEMSEGEGFDAQLVRYWVELVDDLSAIARLVSPSAAAAPFHLDADTLQLLDELRLGDAMQKFRTFAVRTLVQERLTAAGIDVDEIESSFTSKKPLLSVKVRLRDGSMIGWQLQGADWRRFVIVRGSLQGRSEASREARSRYVTEQHAAWLSFDEEQELGPFAAAPSSAHKHFAPDFVHDYIRVSGLSVGTLLTLAERVAKHALDYRDHWSPSGS